MQQIIAVVATAAALLSPISALASDRDEVVAVVKAYNDAGNKGDRSGYESFCTADAVVVDHVPPYLFQGPTACADEFDAVVAWGTVNKIGIDDLRQKVFDPIFFESHGEAAYAVFPV
jgi:ketosteroid isomerase-like protein